MVEGGRRARARRAEGLDPCPARCACGFGFTLWLGGSYVAKLASEALKDVEEEMDAIEAARAVTPGLTFRAKTRTPGTETVVCGKRE